MEQRGDGQVIDWNGDGRVDPTEVVLTEILFPGQPGDDDEIYEDVIPEDETSGEGRRPAKRTSWLKGLLQRRKGAGE